MANSPPSPSSLPSLKASSTPWKQWQPSLGTTTTRSSRRAARRQCVEELVEGMHAAHETAEIATTIAPLTRTVIAAARQVSALCFLFKTLLAITRTHVLQIAGEIATVDARDPRPI